MADPMNAAEVALLNDRNGMFGGDGAFFWIFALLILAGGNFGGFGGRGPMPDVATKDFVQDSVNNQATQTGLRDVLLSSANNNYEMAQRINDQTTALMQQGYTYQIQAEQRFSALQQQIAQMGYQMDRCCCEIKTQMLQNRLDDAQAALVAAQGSISNANQSQYILSQLGRFVAWAPSGSQPATGT